MTRPALIRHATYLHPVYGEIEYIRQYKYRDVLYQFYKHASGAPYVLKLTTEDLECLTTATTA